MESFIDLRRVKSIHLLVKYSFGALITLLKHSRYEAKIQKGISFYITRYDAVSYKPSLGNSMIDTEVPEVISCYMPRYDVSIYNSSLGMVKVPVLYKYQSYTAAILLQITIFNSCITINPLVLRTPVFSDPSVLYFDVALYFAIVIL